MKIGYSHQPTLVKNSPNFKKINPAIKIQLENTIKSPESKNVFVKIASVVGLTSIIGLVTALKKEESSTTSNLAEIDKYWSDKANSFYLNPQTTGEYLDLTSKADSYETEFIAESLLSNSASSNYTPIETRSRTKELFLSPESNETYMTVSANKSANSILNQIKALNSADEETQKSILKEINNRLLALVKHSESLQADEKTSELYTRIANITKNFAFTNILESLTKSTAKPAKEEVEIPEITPIEGEAEDKTESSKENEADDESKTEVPSESNPPSIKILGKMNLKPPKIRRDRQAQSESQPTTPLKPIVQTEENKEFVKIFLAKFGKKPAVKPEVYSDKISFIQQIYESYSASKPMVRNRLLTRLKQENLLEALTHYENLTGGDFSKIGFINFLDLETLKNKNESSITNDDYEKLSITKDTIYKFFNISSEEEKACVTFMKGVSYKDRLKFLSDFHKIAFNIPEDNLIKSKVSASGEISIEDIKTELAQKLANNVEEYANIADFIALDTTDIELEIDNGDTSEAFEVAKERINDVPTYQLDELVKILNNATFDDFVDGVHGRMRFIERIVFKNKKLTGLKSYDIKKATNTEIYNLKAKIENLAYIDMFNYSATNNADRSKNKYSPKVIIDDVTIALNDNARIHTIY